jgi:hypothetical protein
LTTAIFASKLLNGGHRREGQKFLRHLRDPRQPNWKCKECTKTCLLYEDANKKDEQLINEIRKKNDETTSANQETETGQSTSNSSIREPHGTANNRNPRLNRAGNGRCRSHT